MQLQDDQLVILQCYNDQNFALIVNKILSLSPTHACTETGEVTYLSVTKNPVSSAAPTTASLLGCRGKGEGGRGRGEGK
jgi:hypothetical protein